MKKHILLGLIILIGFSLSACEGASGDVSFRPAGIPLIVGYNTREGVYFSAVKDIDIPTPLGTLTAGVVVNPAQHYNVQNTLIVQANNHDYVYNLHGEDFDIRFEPGEYEQVRLKKKDNNLFLILERIDAPKNSSSNESSTSKTSVSNKQVSASSSSSTSKSTYSQKDDGSCDEAPRPHLKIGGKATVVVFQVTVRRSPDGSKINLLARDRVADVLDGPICENEFWWWEIYSAEMDLRGWVAEGDEENYYLEP